eukprot:gene18086-23734_t
MSVQVGSFADPEKAGGLAHFLEHMVFMGSTKYPDENYYDSFVSSHNGSCNAMTEGEIKSNKRSHTIVLTWQLPPVIALYNTKPTGYISHLLGHEGKGSILSVLKSLNYANYLSAGLSDYMNEIDEEDLVENFAISMLPFYNIAREDLLFANYITSVWDPQAIKNIINMLAITNMIVKVKEKVKKKKIQAMN